MECSGMKRSRSAAATIAPPSSASRPSFSRTTSSISITRLERPKVRRSKSPESIITISDSDDETNDIDTHQVQQKHPPKAKSTQMSGKNPISGLNFNQLLDPRLMQYFMESIAKSNSGFQQNILGACAGLNYVQSKPKPPKPPTSKRELTWTQLTRRRKISSSESSESSESSVEDESQFIYHNNGSRDSNESLTSDESIDEFEGGVEEMSEPEDEQDPKTEPSSASQHDFSLADYDTLLSCCSKPRNRLRVQRKSRTLDNAAFFELLMSVRTIDLCISRMYIVNSEIPQAKHSLIDLQGRLFSQTGQLDLCQLTKCVLMDTRDHLKLSERDAKAANLYLDLVKYLIEIFVYLETLAFLRFRVFDMKLQELYEASSGNLPAYLAMIFKLKQPMQQNQMDREPFKDLHLKELNQVKRQRSVMTNREYLKKQELAGRLVNRQAAGDAESEKTDTLVEQLQSVEHLNQLDPTGKVQVIKQLVDLIMFDGITYRAYVNDLRSESNRQLQALKAENTKLKEAEAKFGFSRASEGDKELPEKRTSLRPAQAQYLKDLKYHKSWQTYQMIKQELECVIRVDPVCSVSTVTSSDIRRLNLWSFDNLMSNYLIVESTKQTISSGASKTSWFQISDVNEFTRSLKILLPAAEFNKINRSFSKLNTGHQKPLANTGFDATAPVSLDFLSRLAEFQASRKPKEPASQSDDLTIDDDSQVSDSTQNAESLAHADRIYQSLLDLYERLLVSNLHRWRPFNRKIQGSKVERYEIEIGEESIKIAVEWPNLVAKYKKARSRVDKAGLDPATKDRLLLVMSVMCQSLLDSLHQNTKALPFKFFRELNLGAVLHDYVLVNCSSFQFLDLFITVLKNNIQWENSLENTECQICQETRIKDGSLADNTKIQCSYCNAYFHYGCLTYEEDESKITFFTYGKLPQCSICLISGERNVDQLLNKNFEVESVDVSDYKLRAKKVRAGNNAFLKGLGIELGQESAAKKRAHSVSSATMLEDDKQSTKNPKRVYQNCKSGSTRPEVIRANKSAARWREKAEQKSEYKKPKSASNSSSSSDKSLLRKSSHSQKSNTNENASSSDESAGSVVEVSSKSSVDSWPPVYPHYSGNMPTSSSSSASRGLRARKSVNYQAQLAESEESDSDE